MSGFIPGTMERKISEKVVFRPIRSWHNGTYAGERLRKVGNDGSGCMDVDGRCRIPLTVTHRIYWNTLTNVQLSAFLSYPDAMGYFDGGYFWEICAESGIVRFTNEEEMERAIVEILCPLEDYSG